MSNPVNPVRSRFTDARRYHYDDYSVWMGTVYGRRDLDGLAFWEAQRTYSQGNPIHRLKDGFPGFDIGGSFYTQKVSKNLDAPRVYSLTSAVPSGYYANGVPTLSALRPWKAEDVSSLSDAAMSTLLEVTCPPFVPVLELDAWGAKAVSAVKPTNPTVDLAISLGELISERKFFALPGQAGSLPGEYLNYMFGIAPTIADIQDLRRAITDQEEILGQHVRDSGKLVRRRYYGSPTVETTRSEQSGVALEFLPGNTTAVGWLADSGHQTHVQRKTTRLWFSGAFTYYLPKEGILRDIALLDRLYGVVPGSALAWELMPYSWLVDYKTSAGSVLSNLDAFAQDGLVMPYGYVMCQQEIVDHYTWVGQVCIAGSWTTIQVSGTVTSVTKQRRPANPFGFGFLPGDLTPRQLSIIAALGLTKL